MMKRKYIILLIIIGFLLLCNLLLATSYYLWTLVDQNNNVAINDETCVKIIYSDEQSYNLVNPKALADDDGVISTPRTITITNNCSSEENVELHLDVLNTSTIDENKIKVYVNGEYDLNPTILSNLRYVDGNDNIKKTYRLIKAKMNAGETKRINLRMWLDENATTSLDKKEFDTQYSVASSELVVKPSLAENLIVSYNDTQDVIDYSKVANNEGLFKLNNIYYYRGNVSNNYVSFAGLNWRIVGINSDNTVKMIYSGNDLKSSYNDDATNEESIGYTNSSEINADSTLKLTLNDWYNAKLKDYDEYITNYNFCNDTTSVNDYRITYGGYNRVFNDFSPSFECKQTDKNYGGIYNQKVGLITLDEANFAGGSIKQSNSNYYLYDGFDFYTFSPAFYKAQAWVGIVSKSGKLDATPVNNSLEIRPVINLINSVTVTGDGTIDSPYIIDEI
jgi:hypothetical protein